MNKNVMIVFGGAVVVAVLLAVIVQMFSSVEPPPPPQEEVVPELPKVIVATKDLPVGHILSAEDLAWKEWPEAGLSSEMVRQVGDQAPSSVLTGRLDTAVKAGDPVLTSHILDETKENVIAVRLPAGMRAVAIEVSADSMVGGFIGPGDYVDIVMTYRASFEPQEDNPEIREMVDRNLNRLAAQTLLQNIQVLAVDQTADGRGGEAKLGRTVTLAVTAQEAEKLILGDDLGDLRLVLRAFADDTIIRNEWPTVTDARVIDIDDEINREYQKMKKDTGINRDIVRIYRGAEVVNTSSE